MLTHAQPDRQRLQLQMFWPVGPGDVFQVIAPMFHAAGSTSVLQCIYRAFRRCSCRSFDPAAILDLIEAEGVTATLGVPSMLAAQVEEQLASPRDVSSLRIYAHGGSPIATEVLRRGDQAFPATEFAQVYGATETAPLVTGLRHEELHLDDERVRSCGQPMIGVEIEIRGPRRRRRARPARPARSPSAATT